MLQPRLRAGASCLLERAFSPLFSSQFLQSQQCSPYLAVPKTSPFNLPSYSLCNVRYASHNTQGSANAKGRDPAGKRLGAKKTGDQYVIPGNIIYRQRGTKWFPGENCSMGRDHTIFATETGYVKYYRDPERHPKRKYIGVCFERDGALPTPPYLPRQRRLNMVAVPMQVQESSVEESVTAWVTPARGSNDGTPLETELPLRSGYMYREANWQIGRAAEKAGVKVRGFNRNNRWLAWRKRTARAERAAQIKSLKTKKPVKKPKVGR